MMNNTLAVDRVGQELASPFAGAWYLLICDDLQVDIELLIEVLGAFDLEHQLIEAKTPKDLLQPSGSGLAVVIQANPWPLEAYVELENERATIRQRWTTLLWLTGPDQVAALTRQAPNFASFMLPNIATLTDGTMSDSERALHLEVLREQHGLTDAEVIAKAKQGTLPQDADHHAWLILLGRGDLIGVLR